MSEEKLLLKVVLKENKPHVILGTGHVALLSLALQCADLEVKNQIMSQDEQEVFKNKPAILTPGTDLQIPDGLLKNL